MPKENTHTCFVSRILDAADLREVFPDHRKLRSYLHLGAILPDTFYYAKKPALQGLATFLHGQGALSRNALLEALLGIAGREHSRACLAVILGWLSHLALDTTLHPAIDALSGDFNDPDPDKRRQARSIHYGLETVLDMQLCPRCLLRNHLGTNPHLPPPLLGFLTTKALARPSLLHRTLIRQLRLNAIFCTSWGYAWAWILSRLGSTHARQSLSLFRAHVARNPVVLPSPFEFVDPADNRLKRRSLEELWEHAGRRALLLMEQAGRFHAGRGGVPDVDQVLNQPL